LRLIFAAGALISGANQSELHTGNHAMNDPSAPSADAAAAEPDSATGSQAEHEAKIAELVEALARESAEYKDNYLRALADLENLRKRTERQVADMRQYGIAAFAGDVLAVADNMHRALETAPELRQSSDAGVKTFIEGVELTERELLKTLDKHGVTKFDPKGERFDPNRHQAMYEVPDPSVPAGTITQVMQAGYMIGERVLRPALVAIAKGGPKPAPEPPVNDNAGAAAQNS
jgi:molecular chaperone GrpE